MGSGGVMGRGWQYTERAAGSMQPSGPNPGVSVRQTGTEPRVQLQIKRAVSLNLTLTQSQSLNFDLNPHQTLTIVLNLPKR